MGKNNHPPPNVFELFHLETVHAAIPGDVFLVPSGKPHSIQQLTEHVRLVDCFTPIREDFLQ